MFETQGIRNDDKGRHTTTKRDLIVLTSGGIVIDTPGMRELGIESADLSKAFTDIVQLSEQCRFNNCTHTKEPGCAVKEAIENGQLSEARLSNYFKLKKEARYEGLTSKQIEDKKINDICKEFGSMKNIKKYIKNKYNNL